MYGNGDKVHRGSTTIEFPTSPVDSTSEELVRLQKHASVTFLGVVIMKYMYRDQSAVFRMLAAQP